MKAALVSKHAAAIAARAESSDLTPEETRALQHSERVITKGRNTFIKVGEALQRIREERLYRQTHDTFEKYCREKWGMTKRHCNRLITSAEVLDSVGPMGPKITTERQARELAKVEPERRAEVVEKATVATGGKITAVAIQEAAKEEVEDAELEAAIKTVVIGSYGKPTETKVEIVEAEVVEDELPEWSEENALATIQQLVDDCPACDRPEFRKKVRAIAADPKGGAK